VRARTALSQQTGIKLAAVYDLKEYASSGAGASRAGTWLDAGFAALASRYRASRQPAALSYSTITYC